MRSKTMAPSESSVAPGWSSRTQRARSGETQIFAVLPDSTSPVESHPCTSGSTPGRGSKLSSSTSTLRTRSRR